MRRLAGELADVRVARLDISGDVRKLDGTYDAVSAVDVLLRIVADDRYRRANQ